MRPVNLLPVEQRSGAMGGRIGPAHMVLVGLAVLLLAVVGYVLAANSVASKRDRLAEVERQAKKTEAQAQTLKAFGDFAALKQARIDSVKALAASRFDWEHVIRQFSQAVPYNVWLIKFTAKTNPTVQFSDSGSGSGGSSGTSGYAATGPGVEVIGCTVEQRSVARMLVRMRQLDGVTDVKLLSSKKPDPSNGSGGTGGDASAGGTTDTSDCPNDKGERITKFDIAIEFDAAVLTQSLALGLGAPVPGQTPGATPAATQPAAQPAGAAPTTPTTTTTPAQTQPAYSGGSK